MKAKINSINDGYRSLFTDMRFEFEYNTLYVPRRDWTMYAKITEADYKFIFNELVKDVVSEDNIQLMKFRYGLDNGEAHTLQQCGDVYHITPEGIRVRIRSCFRRMRHRVNLIATFDRILLTERRNLIVKRAE